MIFKNKEIANTFNEYFESTVETLDLHTWTKGSSKVRLSYTNDDGIYNILIKFVNRPSIQVTKECKLILKECSFTFTVLPVLLYFTCINKSFENAQYLTA